VYFFVSFVTQEVSGRVSEDRCLFDAELSHVESRQGSLAARDPTGRERERDSLVDVVVAVVAVLVTFDGKLSL